MVGRDGDGLSAVCGLGAKPGVMCTGYVSGLWGKISEMSPPPVHVEPSEYSVCPSAPAETVTPHYCVSPTSGER